MSFVAFSARFAGNPPAPFAAFAAGDLAFFLVGTVAAGSELPAPGAQLSVFKVKTEGTGRNPVDSVTETAKGWRGRSRVTVAVRTYTYPRFVRGALAAAREGASWATPEGLPLLIWSNLVSVDDAAGMGYRTPRGLTNARPGRRGVGVENNARGTIQGRSVAVARESTPAPVARVSASVAPAALPVDAAAPSGLAALARETAGSAQAVRAASTPTPSWVASFAAAPDATRERNAAIAARDSARAARATTPAPVVDSAPLAPSERFASLDLSDSAPARSFADAASERFASLDLD